MYEKVYTALNPITFVSGYETYLSAFCYSKYWDAVLGKSYYRWYKIFHDGSFARYGTPTGTYLSGSRVNGEPAFWEEWEGGIFGVNEVNGLPNIVKLNPDYLMGFAHEHYPGSSYGWFVDDTAGVFVKRDSHNAFAVRSLTDGSLVRRITHNLNAGFNSLSWVSSGVLCGIRFSDGMVCFVDYLTDQGLISTGMLEACHAAVYDCTCHVFWTYGNDNLVRIYVKEDQPAFLSDPVFSTAPEGMKAQTVTVQLTGITGEPCEGWWIHWELVASGGEGPYGTLESETSKTDEDGYATNTYYGPLDGSTGDTQINTWVEL